MSQISSNVEMIPANNSFYVTASCFKLLEGNRPLLERRKIASIEEAIKNGKILPPIIVDRKTMFILDGQNRHEAHCNLWKLGFKVKMNVLFEDVEDPLLAAIEYNAHHTSWSTENYVFAYIKKGFKDYKLLEQFVRTHVLFQNVGPDNYRGAAQLLTRQACYAVIPRGILKITESQVKDAEIIYQELEKLLPITGKNLMSNILAYVEVRIYIKDFNKFLKAMKKKFVVPIFNSKKAWKNALRDVIDKL